MGVQTGWLLLRTIEGTLLVTELAESYVFRETTTALASSLSHDLPLVTFSYNFEI